MPTGYTAPIYEGKEISFEEFAWGCARAFGALVTMRDSPTDAEIPAGFQPSSYHCDALVEATARWEKVNAWTLAEAQHESTKAYAAEAAYAKKARTRRDELRERYEAMLEQVRAWEPPSPDHDGLKTFMVEQLEGSIDFDASPEYELPTPIRLTGADFKAQELEKASRNITYHREKYAEEVERTETRNAWVKDLRESLGGHLAATGSEA